MKKTILSSHRKKKIRQINYLIISLLKLNRYHSVEKSSKTRSLFLRKNHHFSRQIDDFTKEVTKELISRKFLSVIVFYSAFFCTLCYTGEIFHEINSLVTWIKTMLL